MNILFYIYCFFLSLFNRLESCMFTFTFLKVSACLDVKKCQKTVFTLLSWYWAIGIVYYFLIIDYSRLHLCNIRRGEVVPPCYPANFIYFILFKHLQVTSEWQESSSTTTQCFIDTLLRQNQDKRKHELIMILEGCQNIRR